MISRYLASSWVAGEKKGGTRVSGKTGNTHTHTVTVKGRETGDNKEQTYRAKGNSSSGQAYQASIASVRLVNGIGKLITELIENGLNLGVVLCGNHFSDDAL